MSITGFFREHGVRETFESVVVAIILALMFKSFIAEAYIIPTGSMAPTLRGEHMDVVCEKCELQYLAGSMLPGEGPRVSQTYCPICQYRQEMKPNSNPDDQSFDGDRILVNKFIYDFVEPSRWEVIVFKNPKNAKQNYIKRLVGLPNESLLIERGDIYTYPTGSSFAEREIAKKDPRKARAMLQLVDDTDHIASSLEEAGWPSRWNDWRNLENPSWDIKDGQVDIRYSTAAEVNETRWLSYRHAIPRPQDWDDYLGFQELPPRIQRMKKGEVSGAGLILDRYSYNEFNREGDFQNPAGGGERPKMPSRLGGYHWVGDLAVEAWVDIASTTGSVLLRLTDGGADFICELNIATGEATLRCEDERITFVNDSGDALADAPFATNAISGNGKQHLMFANLDDRLFLWVNNHPIDFGSTPYQDFVRTGEARPTFSKNDPGDLEPAGIGANAAEVNISRIKIWRDVYYVSPNLRNDITYDYRINDDTAFQFYRRLQELFENPNDWDGEFAKKVFDSQAREEKDVEVLGESQLFPMGDNSPSSLDARVWSEPAYLTEDMLLGRALFIYWPHSLNKPIKFFPNFKQMEFIR